MKKLITSVMAVIMLLTSVFTMSGCSGPEYAEIEARFIELVESSYGINKILFGTGLPTYERVYDPKSNVEVYQDGGTRYYYYEIEDEAWSKVIAYRSSYLSPYVYLGVTEAPIEGETAVYEDLENGMYYYSIEYTEKTYDFYYSESDPLGYDYVSADSEYYTVDSIKAAAELVYSPEYLKSLYEALFTGAVVSESTSGLSARYIEYASDSIGTALMMSNTYKPLVTETRIFDFTTANMVRSNKKIIDIECETYLESKPEERTVVRVTLANVDGVWYLDSGTY